MMKKILFLDGSLNSTDQSYSTTTMNYVCQLFDPKEFQVKRVNLNDSKFASNSLNSHTFSILKRCWKWYVNWWIKKHWPTSYFAIDDQFWSNFCC
ncbi:hypothetical protein NW069_02960 [Mycoplasmopsis cynos]|uniref:hypothetical protein n=1 Tax=Mycoplasmopsis cynos TaxID=171284 RepID=UPI00220DAD15|nr:hypothetical protein [Mycoplasmopsis cynos]UWV80299.1 hypothetical protein NW069_02960 [Mycoplasmopsis cynos]